MHSVGPKSGRRRHEAWLGTDVAHGPRAMSNMQSAILFTFISVGLTAGCADKPRAEATAEPGKATATVREGEGNDRQYDESKLTRTGVYIDPKIAQACGLQQPDTFFAFDSAELGAQSRETLESVATCLSKGALKGQEVVLVGHTDPQGTDEYNQQLGKTRADSVAEFLKDKGVEKARIDTESEGEEEASGDAAQWPRDRRVDIMLGGEAPQ